MSVPVIPTCPTDCSSMSLEPSFSECAPETHVGEINKLYISPIDEDPFNDVTDLAEWTTRLKTDANPTGDIVEFTVIGDMPEGETSEISISNDRIARGRTRFNLNLEVDETGSDNYEVARALSGCTIKYNVWWQTAGGMIYGGNVGVEATVKANFVIPRERTELEKIMLNVTWTAKFLPERAVSPLT